MQTPLTNQPTFPERSIALSIVFTVITCGIYGLYWMYKLNTETCILAREPEDPSSGMVVLFSIITCGIYGIYWAYQQGCRFQREARSRGMADADDCPMLYLILQIANYFVGVTGIVNMALMQDRINNILRFRTQGIYSQYAGYGQYGQTYSQYDENGNPYTYERYDSNDGNSASE